MADFSLLGTPNFAQAALSGYQAGAAIGKQRQLDAASANIDLDRPETLLPILRADPSTGAALAGVALKMHAAKQEQAALGAKSDYLAALAGSGVLGGGGASASAAAVPTAAPGAPAATDAQPNDIVVTAPQPHADIETARAAMIRADPDGYMDLETKLGTMNKAQREQIDAANQTFGSVVEAAKAMPYEQRRQYIATQRAQLAAHGVPEAQIDGFDPTDGNIVGIENEVLGIKGVLDKQDKDRAFGLQQQREDRETRQGDQRIELEGAQVGISAGHLALDRKADSRASAKSAATGGGSAQVAVSRPLPGGGQAYRNPANGKWYDNPGFK